LRWAALHIISLQSEENLLPRLAFWSGRRAAASLHILMEHRPMERSHSVRQGADASLLRAHPSEAGF
jgi:hypothetical protein